MSIQEAREIGRDFLSLFIPIALILFMGSWTSSFERVCLARHSLDALNGSVQAGCILQFFQLTCIVFANMAQVFVGKQVVEGRDTQVGSHTWQMIWLSLFSMGVVLPLSLLADPFYFYGTQAGEIGRQYFRVLIFGNFLFPLGAVLIAFFLAQGKKGVVFVATFGSCLVTVGLNLLLISHYGAVGAAWSGLIGKAVLCVWLFIYFLSPENQRRYHTHEWKIDRSSIFKCLSVCSPRAVGKAFAILIWTATAYLMVAKGGHYLSILAIGSTITLFCFFFLESLTQTLTLIFSRCVTSQEYAKLWKTLRLAIGFGLLFSLFLGMGCVFFQESLLGLFFPKGVQVVEGHLLRSTLHWVSIWVALSTVNAVFLAFLLSCKDTMFYMIVMSLTWLTSCVPVYYCLYRLHWAADKFWFILIFDQLAVLCINGARIYSLQRGMKRRETQEIS